MDLSKQRFTTSFVQRRNLNRLMGNLRYISSEKRQDFLEDYYNPKEKSWWKALADYADMAKERSKHKYKSTIQAREYIVRFTKDTYDNKAFTAKDISDSIYERFGLVAAVALHHSRLEDENEKPILDSNGHTIMNEENYHAHIVVCDRVLNPKPKYAYRNIYLDETGKRVYKKELAKTIVPKGSYVPTSMFGPKIRELRNKAFTEEIHDWACEFNNKHSKIYDVSHIKTEDKRYESMVKIGRNRPAKERTERRMLNNDIAEFNSVKYALERNLYYEDSYEYLGGFLNKHLFKAVDKSFPNIDLNKRKKYYGMAIFINENGGLNNYKNTTYSMFKSWYNYNEKRVEEEIYKFYHPEQDEYDYGYGMTR